jgi:branched-chain amino acid transport system permease protein
MIHPIIISSVVSASALSLLAMGFTLQYLTTRFPNLAYTSVAMASAYIALTFYISGLSPYIAMPFSFLAGGVLSLVFYRILSLLQDKGIGLIGLMIASLGLDFIVYGFVNIFADYITYTLKVFAREFQLRAADFMVFDFAPGVFFISLGTAVALAIFFHLFLTRTRLGIAMRAIVQNYSLAWSQGINIEFVLSVSWFLVGGLAGIAGCIWPMWFTTSPFTGAIMLTRILAAVVVGGLLSIYGSLLGGFIIGGVEGAVLFTLITTLGTWVGPYRLIIPVAITCAMLILAPHGIADLIAKFREGKTGSW